MTVSATGAAARVVAATTTFDVPIEPVIEWFSVAENLPSWSGFFSEVDAAGPDGRSPAMSLAGVISTWTEVVRGPERDEVAICSLIHGRTERAVLSFEQLDSSGTRVEFVVTVLRPESEAALETQRARMTDELAAARRLLEVRA